MAMDGQYIRSPFLDERYQQNKISASPFSSAKRHLVRVEKVLPPISVATHKPIRSEEEFKQQHGIPPYFSCKMNYPYTLAGSPGLSKITSPRPPGHPDSVSPHSASGTVGTTSAEQTPAQCSDQASLHSEPTSEPAVESPARKTVKRAFVQPPHPQQPNPYWQQPPPTLDPVPDLVNPQPKTKADEWHPLLATSQAAGLAFRSEAASSPTRASAAVTDEASKGSDAEEEDPVSLTTRAAVLLSQALFSPLPPHTVPANAARSANALRPAAERGVRFQQNSRTTPHIHNNNNYQNKTFHNLNNITVAPPASYRTLKPEVRHILQTRNPKTRGMLEHELHHTNPVVEPPVRPMRPVTPVPEPEPEEPVEGEEGEGGVDGGLLEMPPATVDEPVPEAAPKKELIIEAPASDNNKTVARYNARTGEIEFDGRSDDSSEADESEDAETNVPEEKTYSLSAALGMDSHFNLWNSVVDSKCEHENVDADPGHMPTPVDDVAGRRRVKIVTQKLVSVYNPTLRRPVLQQYLCGQGQRMGNTLIITTPESTSSFTEKLPDHLKKLNVLNPPQTAGPSSGIGPTPSMAFSCDDDPCAFAWVDESLAALLTEKGGDVEEIMLEGQTWLSDDLLFKIGEFCPNLKLLNLAGCMQLSSRTIIRIAEGCQLLALVNLSHCTNVSGEAVARLLQNCPQLQVLCLSGLPLDHGGVSTFRTLHSSRRIRALDLSYCAGLTDQSLIAISQYCPALEWLNLSGCTSVGDMGVAAIGSRLTRLAVLIMKLCSQDTLRPAGLHALANGIRNLKRLDLSGVTQLDNATLKHILKQSLSISGCKGVSDESIRQLNSCCQQLEALDISSCVGIELQSLMDLMHDVHTLSQLVVTNSCIPEAQVNILRTFRPNCRIVRNDFVPPRTMKISAMAPL